ncbi:MAG: sugar-specific transcriptional regulator TrmB [Oceanicoccus sp.]|jgi:sugar-specific transcriptional regulator TrmB
MLERDLNTLGLNDEESKVYLTVLGLGGSYASTIANKAGVARVNCYYVLESLRKKGLITINLKENVKFFVAEPPQVLINQMEEKYNTARKLVPQLMALTSEHGFKPVIRTYEGVDGIKSIFDQTLSAESEVLGYTNLEALGELLPEYLPAYTEKLVKKKTKVRWLSPSSEKSREFLKTFYPKNFPPELVEILFVNPKEFAFENQIAIYDNKVAITSLNPDELIGVLIESSVYARTQRAVFNLSWLGATAFVAQ